MAPKTAPPLNAPESQTTVQVSAIDTTLALDIVCSHMWTPSFEGFDKIPAGTWSFLIEHPSGRKLLYDLGARKDWRNLPPYLDLEKLVDNGVVGRLEISKNVDEILTAGGVDLKEIEGIIWSHWHFDHTGDPSTFPSNTKVIVGKGFKDEFLPGYPADPKGKVLESDFKDRELMELDFDDATVHIGRFKAIDYFGDGSFYILDSPGHAIGHINALARTNSSPAAFIHLGGDSIHHVGEIRPSVYMPLPESIEPSPVPKLHSKACPGHIFTKILRDGSDSEHILELRDLFKDMPGVEDKFKIVYDEPALKDTVRKDEELDADKDVFTIIAHDWSLKGIIDEWPESLNTWQDKGWKESTRWKFLEDFEKVVA